MNEEPTSGEAERSMPIPRRRVWVLSFYVVACACAMAGVFLGEIATNDPFGLSPLAFVLCVIGPYFLTSYLFATSPIDAIFASDPIIKAKVDKAKAAGRFKH